MFSTTTLGPVGDGPRSGLTVEAEVAGRSASIGLTGEITRGTFQGLIDAVRGALADGCTRVSLCMRRVRFLDAPGLTAVIVVARMAADAGADLSIAQPSPFAARILEIGGLDQLCERAPATGSA